MPDQTPDLTDLTDLYSALDSAHTVMALSSQDWSAASDFAWLYGILCGWDNEDGDATDEIAARFRWDADKVARLRRLRTAVAAFDLNAVCDLMTAVSTQPMASGPQISDEMVTAYRDAWAALPVPATPAERVRAGLAAVEPLLRDAGVQCRN